MNEITGRGGGAMSSFAPTKRGGDGKSFSHAEEGGGAKLNLGSFNTLCSKF